MEKITQGHEMTQSPDFVKENIEILKSLFPTIVKEGKIDWSELQALLGNDIETDDEYYRLTWAGKSMARKEANKPSTATLRPNKADSKDWDTTQNIFIEGDNLEVLKVLQKSYTNKIKMIYIDPPYNTGSDFVYTDNYADNLNNYLEITGQLDESGKRTSTNTENDGRYHSNWLNMMYPRLKLARNLLTDDGVIFISIDDNEVHNLRKVCDEIFGEDNFVNCIAVKMSEASGVKMNHQKSRFPKIKEYLLFYKMSQFKEFVSVDKYKQEIWDKENNIFLENFTQEDRDYIYEFENKEELGDNDIDSINNRLLNVKKVSLAEKIRQLQISENEIENWKFNNAYRIIKTAGSSSLAKLVRSFNVLPKSDIASALSSEGVLFFYITDFNRETKTPRFQVIFADSNIYKNPCDFWQDIKTTGAISDEGGVKYTNGKKPLKLLNRIVKMNTTNNDVVLDFFAGSATTAHSVMLNNLEDGKSRKFIMVQLPENLESNFKTASGEAKKSIKESIDFLTSINKPLYLTELGKERIRISGEEVAQAFKKRNTDDSFELFQNETNKKIEIIPDVGFKVFKLDRSNIIAWDGNPENLETNLFNAGSNIKENRKEEDVLYEILLKNGLDLAQPIEKKVFADKTVFNVGFGALFICLADGVTTDVAEGIGKWKQELEPSTCKVIFKDNGFTDVEKTNSMQILKRYGIEEVNTI